MMAKLQKSKQSVTRLLKNPQKKAICLSVFTVSPKKPNSANRRIAKINISSFSRNANIKIPGEGISNLQQHSVVLVQGVHVRDLIGVQLSAIRGKYDLSPVLNRKTSRSRYGAASSST